MLPAEIYLFKVNNWNNRTMCRICFKLTTKTLERPKCTDCQHFLISIRFGYFMLYQICKEAFHYEFTYEIFRLSWKTLFIYMKRKRLKTLYAFLEESDCILQLSLSFQPKQVLRYIVMNLFLKLPINSGTPWTKW